jgi:hypothetical protein
MAEFQKPAYITELGESYIGNSLELLETLEDESINLVMTSLLLPYNVKKLMAMRIKPNILIGLHNLLYL